MSRAKRAALIVLVVSLSLICATIAPAPAAQAAISDIATHWARTEITSLIDTGVVAGYEDGTFRPDIRISRVEFITLLNRAAGVAPADYAGSFPDVKATDWFAGQVAAAVKAGFTAGYSNGTFGPKNNITRNEVAVILSRALGLDARAGDRFFSDTAAIPVWAEPSVEAAARAGLIRGYADGSFGGGRNLTRAEAAVLIARAMSSLKPGTPVVALTATTAATASAKADVPVTFTFGNTGGRIGEKVAVEVTISRDEGPVTWPDITASYLPEGPTQVYNFNQTKAATGKEGAVMAQVGASVGYGLAAGAQHTIRASFSFKEVGTYHLTVQVLGLASGQPYGDPVQFTIQVDPVTAILTITDTAPAVGKPLSFPIGIWNGEAKPLPEKIVPQLTFAKMGDRALAAGDITVRYQRPGRPGDPYVDVVPAATSDATHLRYLMGPATDVNPPISSFGATLGLTFNTPGTYEISLQAIGADSGKPYGSAKTYVMTAWDPGPPGDITFYLSHYGIDARIVADSSATPFSIAYRLSSGLMPEKTEVRLHFIRPGITVDDIKLHYLDWSDMSTKTVQVTQSAPDTLDAVWNPTSEVLWGGIDRQWPVSMNAAPGQYLVKAELVGQTTGAVYAETSTGMNAARLGATFPMTKYVIGKNLEYSVKVHNANPAATPDNFTVTLWINKFLMDYVPTIDDLSLQYQDPIDQQWKPATLVAGTGTGYRMSALAAQLGGPDGYHLEPGADLIIPLRWVLNSDIQVTVDAEMISVSGEWYGDNLAVDTVGMSQIPH